MELYDEIGCEKKERGEEGEKGEERRTVFVVYGDGVGCPVGIFVFGDHHREVELFEPVAG